MLLTHPPTSSSHLRNLASPPQGQTLLITIEARGSTDVEYEVEGITDLQCPGQSPGQRVPTADFSVAALENQEGSCSSSAIYNIILSV